MKLKEFPSRDRFDALARTCNVIPVCREILADMETPVSLLKKMLRRRRQGTANTAFSAGECGGR